MDISRLIARYNLLLTHNFFDEVSCQRVIQQAQAGGSDRATVYGQGDVGFVNAQVRRSSRLKLPMTTIEFVNQRLIGHKTSIERHFSISLNDCEEPQFLRYDIGDFFVAHQDGNTGLLQLSSDNERKVSVVIFLNSQGERADYSGGNLKFSDYRAEPEYSEFFLPAYRGTLVAFRSELTHEVTPVTRGTRYSIVSWYR
jgi:SM-20-related protein